MCKISTTTLYLLFRYYNFILPFLPRSAEASDGGTGKDTQMARRSEGSPGGKGPRGGTQKGRTARTGPQGAGGLVQASRGNHFQDKVSQQVSSALLLRSVDHISCGAVLCTKKKLLREKVTNPSSATRSVVLRDFVDSPGWGWGQYRFGIMFLFYILTRLKPFFSLLLKQTNKHKNKTKL